MDATADLKAFITAKLRANCDPVAPKTATGQEVHLSVWTTRTYRRAIGVELDHKTKVNLWVVSPDVPSAIPSAVTVANKVWHGSGWEDETAAPGREKRGANSNLKGYDAFRTKPLTRLGVQSIDDARAILDHLLS
jgi:hypothetical protein